MKFAQKFIEPVRGSNYLWLFCRCATVTVNGLTPEEPAEGFQAGMQ